MFGLVCFMLFVPAMKAITTRESYFTDAAKRQDPMVTLQ